MFYDRRSVISKHRVSSAAMRKPIAFAFAVVAGGAVSCGPTATSPDYPFECSLPANTVTSMVMPSPNAAVSSVPQIIVASSKLLPKSYYALLTQGSVSASFEALKRIAPPANLPATDKHLKFQSSANPSASSFATSGPINVYLMTTGQGCSPPGQFLGEFLFASSPTERAASR